MGVIGDGGGITTHSYSSRYSHLPTILHTAITHQFITTTITIMVITLLIILTTNHIVIILIMGIPITALQVLKQVMSNKLVLSTKQILLTKTVPATVQNNV